jgi:hypothetical protein
MVEWDEMNVSTQWLDKQFPATKNTHESPEELLDMVFCVRSILCQRREGNFLFYYTWLFLVTRYKLVHIYVAALDMLLIFQLRPIVS